MRLIASEHMTLGAMIARYDELGDYLVENPGEAMSARAVYAHVGFDAFGADPPRIPAHEAAAICRAVIGETFQGYKGGDFTMDERSPVWIAKYGDSGYPLLTIDDHGELVVGGEGRMW